MNNEITTIQSLESLKKSLEEDLLGKVPLFFSSLTLNVKNEKEDDSFMTRIEVPIEAFQTTKYDIPKAIRKPISKVIDFHFFSE